MFQGVHLQKCGEVLRYLGSDTSFTSRLPPGVELNGSSTTLLGAATLVVFLRNRASFGPADGINRRGFLLRVRLYPNRRRATCRRRYIFTLLYPGKGGDSPAGLGGNNRIRWLLNVGRRRRGHQSTGVLFARPPTPYSTASHAPFSRYSNFSHRIGGGIQQQLASPLPLPALLPLPWTFWPLKGPVEMPTEVFM
jgi:hypothetical protein